MKRRRIPQTCSPRLINQQFNQELSEECLFITKDKAKLEQLDLLRSEIRNIDEQLLLLLSKRLECAKEIGKIKNELKIPVRNFQVEKQVFRRVENISEKIGLPNDFSSSIFEQIILASVKTQTSLPNMNGKESNMKVLILGGMGRMGKWFSLFCTSNGMTVKSFDPHYPETDYNLSQLPDNLDVFDMIVISTPLNRIAKDVKEILQRRPSGLIFDIASLKTEIIQELQSLNLNGIKYVSTHPMFGPTAMNLHGKNLIICKVKSEKAVSEVVELFEDTSASLKIIPIEEHDTIMSYSLNLAHFVNILMGTMLSKHGPSFKTLKQFSSTTFEKQIKTTSEVVSENPELYWAIQHQNSHRDILFDQLVSTCNQIFDASEKATPTEFRQLMKNAHDYFQMAGK